MNSLVVYTNSEGKKEFRKVPEGSSPDLYEKGILVGPPDFENLSLTKKQKLILSNAIVDAGIVDYNTLAGKRRILMDILMNKLKIRESEARNIRNQIISIYQQETIVSED